MSNLLHAQQHAGYLAQVICNQIISNTIKCEQMDKHESESVSEAANLPLQLFHPLEQHNPEPVRYTCAV